MEAVQPEDSQANHENKESDTDDDEICQVKPMPFTTVEATEAVKALRDLVMSLEEPGTRVREFLRSLSMMDDAFLRLEVKEKRQAKLHEYFRK